MLIDVPDKTPSADSQYLGFFDDLYLVIAGLGLALIRVHSICTIPFNSTILKAHFWEILFIKHKSNNNGTKYRLSLILRV